VRDPHLALALLGVATGLMTGLAKEKAMTWVLAIAASIAAAMAFPFHGVVAEQALAVTWALLILTAGASLLPQWIRRLHLPPILGGLSGWAAGSIGVASGKDAIGSFAAGLVLSVIVAALLAKRGWTLPIRIGAGWLIAIGALNATLTILPVTPGYLPDHLE